MKKFALLLFALSLPALGQAPIVSYPQFPYTGTTAVPFMLFQPFGTAHVAWQNGGTWIGINQSNALTPSNFLDFWSNGQEVFYVDHGGNITTLGTITSNGITGNVTTIPASATPAINPYNGSLQHITLNANATATLTSLALGQRLVIEICQPASGGPYTWAWPTAMHGGMTIGTNASQCSIQAFNSYNGTTFVPESTGITNVAP